MNSVIGLNRIVHTRDVKPTAMAGPECLKVHSAFEMALLIGDNMPIAAELHKRKITRC